MDNYTGEVMNTKRDAMAANAAYVDEVRADMIEAGAKWFNVLCLDHDGKKFTQEILAYNEPEARTHAAENSFADEVLSAMTQDELEAA
jgi:hypothetical protein